ncbi:MAG: thioredoxin domain-containing protein [Alphaproteobacteria bacterium]|nr:thioredoxin domain-containing protein [Alphaproteobacteria bacterium]
MKKSVLVSVVIAICVIIAVLGYTKSALFSPIFYISEKFNILGTQTVLKGVRNISKEDHYIGDPKSRITVIEYSDLSCFFCAATQQGLERLVKEKKVNLVYRHLLPQQTKDSLLRAKVGECIAQFKGRTFFWDYVNYIFNNFKKINESEVERYYLSIGIQKKDMNTCLQNNDFDKKIASQTKEATSLFAHGTPFIVYFVDGFPVQFSYSQPYRGLQKIIDDINKKNI